MQHTAEKVCPRIIKLNNVALSPRTDVTSAEASATSTSNKCQYVRTVRETGQVKEDFKIGIVSSETIPLKKKECPGQFRETFSIFRSQLSETRKLYCGEPVRRFRQLKACQAVTNIEVRIVGDNKTTCSQAWRPDHWRSLTFASTVADSFRVNMLLHARET